MATKRPRARTGSSHRRQRSRERLATSQAPARPGFWDSPLAVRGPAALLLCGCLWVLVTMVADPRFRIEAVQVQGAEQVSKERIAEAMPVMGRSVFALRGSEIQRSLEQRFGCLESVQLQVALPNQVLIRVKEKDVALVWESGGRYWWLGPKGEVYGETDDPANLVVVSDVSGTIPLAEGYVAGLPVRLVRELDRELAANRHYDYVPDLGLIAYVTSAGWPVYLGHQGDAAVKVAVLRSLVEALVSGGGKVEYIDLRDERRPTYKPVAAGR